MGAFFQWLYRLLFSRKDSTPRKPVLNQETETRTELLSPDNTAKKLAIISVDNTSQEIELICHQIEQSIQGVHSYIRCDKNSAKEQLANCKLLITRLDNIMKSK